MKLIELEKRSALSRLLADARASRGWNLEETAERASDSLRGAAATERAVSREERELWRSFEVTRHHVTGLENCPAAPLATLERRARLLGVVLALGVDRALVNRLAGGV